MSRNLFWKDFVAKIMQEDDKYIAIILNMPASIKLTADSIEDLTIVFATWVNDYLKKCEQENKTPEVENIDDVMYLLDSQSEYFVVDRIEDNDMVVLERKDRTHIVVSKFLISTKEPIEENRVVLFDNVAMEFRLGPKVEKDTKTEQIKDRFAKARKK